MERINKVYIFRSENKIKIVMGFIEEQIQKNIANRVAIEKAMGKEFTESDCLDLLEKAGKAAQMGEVRTWNGKEYIKTPKGWRPKPKGCKEGEKK